MVGRFLARTATAILLLPYLGLIAILIVLPFAAILVKSFTTGKELGFALLLKPDTLLSTAYSLTHYVELLSVPYYQRIIWTTFVVAALATFVLTAIAIPTGYYIVRNQRWGGVVSTIVTFPSLQPAVTVAYSILWFLSPTGVVNYVLYDFLHLVDQPINVATTIQGVVMGDIALFSTLTVRMLSSIFAMLDPAVEEASLSLGASPRQTFVKVALPMVLPGIVAAAVFVFVRTMAAYVTALILGGGAGGVNVVPLEIYLNMLSIGFTGDLPLASAFSVILIAITIGGRALFVYFMRRNFREYLEKEML
ncbi:MAG TPA: ABC transporter permease subunit [Chloroflexota bacterium]